MGTGREVAIESLSLTRLVSRHRWAILAAVLVGGVLAAVWSTSAEERYETVSALHLTTVVSGSLTAIDYEVAVTDTLLNTYLEIARSESVATSVANDLGLDDQLDYDVIRPAGTELLQITGMHSDPETAATISNGVAAEVIEISETLLIEGTRAVQESLNQQVEDAAAAVADARSRSNSLSALLPADSPDALRAERDLEAAEATYAQLSLQTQVREALSKRSLTLLAPAAVPSESVKLSTQSYALLGSLAGLMLGLGWAALLEVGYPRIATRSDLEKATGGPAFEVPDWNKLRRARSDLPKSQWTLGRVGDGSLFDESIGRLWGHVSSVRDPKGSMAIIVVGAETGAGTSTIAAHLAAWSARSGAKTVLVDTNLRSPALHRLFSRSDEVGLSNLPSIGHRSLVQASPLEGLDLVLGGQPSSPIDVLGSPGFEQYMSHLRGIYHMIVLDTAAVLPFADSVLLANLVDGFVFVTIQGKTRLDSLTEGRARLSGSGAGAIGFVLNRSRGKLVRRSV